MHSDDTASFSDENDSEYSFSTETPSEAYRNDMKWAEIEREASLEALDRDDVDYQRDAWQCDCSF